MTCSKCGDTLVPVEVRAMGRTLQFHANSATQACPQVMEESPTRRMTLRERVRCTKRFARLLASDDRLPKWLRWLFRAVVAIKIVPVPDLGIDEALLVVGVIALRLRYWDVVRELAEEAKSV
ncbi:MAG: hypothetical protein KGL39_04100 [Patescibacteria group bacterium]|nr:hypothetical protein [Patescibacteria group bacterium]